MRMKKKLPEFPRIPRVITEDIVSVRTLFIFKLLLISLISAMLVMQIVRELTSLPNNIAQANVVENNRQKIVKEITYWKQIADKYTGYRDVYYRIAVLEYARGNVDEAKIYIQKALDTDPNFDAGRVLGEKIKL